MNENIPLHWSFDHNYGAQRTDFADELCNALQEYQASLANQDRNVEIGQHNRRVYQILPNTWRGYKGKSRELSIGTIVIERKYENGSSWNYEVQYQNTTSGEELTFNFCCRDEKYLPINNTWQVDVQNSSSDRYTKLSVNGKRTSDTEIQLRINDTEIAAGTVDNSLPLTCNWALFDVIPTIANYQETLNDKVEIAILEDLEHLRPNCHLGYLESIQSPLQLDGYFLYGTGLLPSYWWVDANQNVVIVSAVFETFVLKEITGGTK